MPFPDEKSSRSVEVVPHRHGWAAEGREIAAALAQLLPDALAVDHIGSTAVPGLPAKDCIDLMVRVDSLARIDLGPLSAAGYRERPEEWNRAEALAGSTHPKRVFAPPVGGRSMNIHVREAGAPTARYSLLFRDFLRSSAHHRDTWGRLKTRLAEERLDIYAYGQVKAAAQPLLMALAEQWAAETGWQP
ncbi:hypothetical protein CFI00_04945 [Nocardioides sp. S5]|uniref:GrpB family protein n=1 Tax=Nocardioides sp. S5 TaxID=2017486 RepID=UPI001A8C762A|nr:GrpB family protein [Nocardioides sp. S5]QSR29864.1 hypothetical protein CFI00_04945 [Nocardioides sp. S5]